MTQQMGRPSTYTPELASEICAQLAEGKSLRTVCLKNTMPDKSTIFRWLSLSNEEEWAKDFRDQYARAKQEASDAMADELLDIVDDGSNDWMEVHMGGYTKTVVDQEAVQRSKLRAETRKWLMSKMKPKKYGDKLDLTSDGKRIETTPIVISDIKSRNAETKPEATTSGSGGK